jgi:hypothetical protein
MASPTEEEPRPLADLVGTWRLDSAYFLSQKTGDRVDILGADPFGYFILEPGGRMIALMTSGGRSPGDVTALHTSMISYTGRVTIDGDKAVTHVDGAWDPNWVGTEQVRFYTHDGRKLSLRSAPLQHPSFPDDEVVAYVDWEKET